MAFARFAARCATLPRSRERFVQELPAPALPLVLGPHRDEQDPRRDVPAVLLDRERGRSVAVAEHFVAFTEAHVLQFGFGELFLGHRGAAKFRERSSVHGQDARWRSRSSR